MIKKILLVLGVILIGIQGFRPEKNEATGPFPNDISTKYAVPADVAGILERSCYDCHSNNTKYPWYAEIQPVAWWLNDHVEEGKHHLNFNEFASYEPKKAAHKLEEVAESVRDGWMPMDEYLWVHKDAKLTDIETQKIIAWTDTLRKALPVPDKKHHH